MLNYFLCCQESYEDEMDIWFSAYHHNGLYRIDKRKQELHRMASFLGEKEYGLMLYKAVVRIKDWLVFVPCAANEIAVYNYRQNQMRKIPLKAVIRTYKILYAEEFKFWTAIPYGDYVYLFGLCYPAIIRLNPETEEIVYMTEWAEALEFRIKDNRSGYWSEGIVRGNCAYLPCMCAGLVLKFHLESGVMELIKPTSKADGFFGIGDDGTNLWLTPLKSQDIVKWNPDTGKVKEIHVMYRKKDVFPFYPPLLINKEMYLMPFRAEDIYIIDLETDTVKWHRELSDKIKTQKKANSTEIITVLHPHVVKDGFYYINNRDYSWRFYNVREGTEYVTYWEAKGKNREYIEQLYVKNEIGAGNILIENKEIGFSSFLQSIACGNFAEKTLTQNDIFGETIYKSTMDAC